MSSRSPNTTPSSEQTRAVVNALDSLGIRYETNAPLGPRTWYHVGGQAAALAHLSSVEQLAALLRFCHEQGVPIRVLGSGANLLVRDGVVDGVVVQLDEPAFVRAEVDLHSPRLAGGNGATTLRAGAGCDLFKLVQDTARKGLAGLEAVAGIPASVGGAIRMNAGGSFGQIGDVVASVKTLSATGEIREWDRASLGFGYRHCGITDPIIIEAAFELSRADPVTVKGRVKEIFAYKKNSQPMGDDSAGCAFKNPSESSLTAGQLIERAGLKSFRIGHAYVSDIHANFIAVDKGSDAGADDIAAVMAHVGETVAARFGVKLQREVVIWP